MLSSLIFTKKRQIDVHSLFISEQEDFHSSFTDIKKKEKKQDAALHCFSGVTGVIPFYLWTLSSVSQSRSFQQQASEN